MQDWIILINDYIGKNGYIEFIITGQNPKSDMIKSLENEGFIYRGNIKIDEMIGKNLFQ